MVVTSNGTSFDYVAPTIACENGPTALHLYSTPQYKVDLQDQDLGGAQIGKGLSDSREC